MYYTCPTQIPGDKTGHSYRAAVVNLGKCDFWPPKPGQGYFHILFQKVLSGSMRNEKDLFST